jgi:hypothetical protein
MLASGAMPGACGAQSTTMRVLSATVQEHGEAQPVGTLSLQFDHFGECASGANSAKLASVPSFWTESAWIPCPIMGLDSSNAKLSLPADDAGVDEVQHATGTSLGMHTVLTVPAIGKIETFMPTTHHLSPSFTGL